MSVSEGKLRRIEVIHHERMHWWPRGITPSNVDGFRDAAGNIVFESGYMIDVGGKFLFQEWMVAGAEKDPESGQANAIKWFVKNRLWTRDRCVIIYHNASEDEFGITHIWPENIVGWTMARGGSWWDWDNSSESGGWEDLRSVLKVWAESDGL